MHIMTQASLAALLLAAATTIHAGPGALEINQACVEEGCFPGDNPGFPVEINSSGAYVLTSDVVTPDATTTAISIRSENVTFDLGGFTIRGTNQCTGLSAEGCIDTSLSGYGIQSSKRNIVVRNGITRGFGFGGIVLTGELSRIEQVRSEHNYRVGLRIGEGGTIIDSQANFNGYLGIECAAARILRVSVMNNGQTGVASARSIIDGSIITRNAGNGIGDSYGSIIRDSTISLNGLGIWLSSGGTRIVDSQIFGNIGVGIFAQPAAPPDLPSSETLVSTFSGLSVYENNGGNDNPQIGGSGGLWTSLGQNLCARDTTCP